MKITKQQLKQIIKEEINAANTVDDYHTMLLKTAERYAKLSKAYPDRDFLLTQINKLHSLFANLEKRLITNKGL
tara:strand:- start:52 stop:273 length:222 start_codon:yes stop_codon:yes gene_type:complete